MSDTRRKQRGPAGNNPKPRLEKDSQSGHGEPAQQKVHRPSQLQRERIKSAHTAPSQASPRSGILDSVRKIVQEEGRTARNLVQYNVPVSLAGADSSTCTAVNSSRSSSQQKRSASRSQSHRTPPPGSRFRHRSLSDMTKSPRSDRKKNDLRARYWKYMFDNFQRAVDSIYQTCEQDESVVECKEVIMMLEQSTKDFKALIETLNMMKAYEDSAKDGDRPAAVAWEVRKMSPNKHAPMSPVSNQQPMSPSKHGPMSPVSNQHPAVTHSEKSGHSWADKVKRGGARMISFSSCPYVLEDKSCPDILDEKSSPDILDDKNLPVKVLAGGPQNMTEKASSNLRRGMSRVIDQDGWETVQRGRLRARQSPCQKSTENLSVGVRSTKRNLTRSLSVPDQANPQDLKHNQPATPQKTSRAVSERHLPASGFQAQERSPSNDSEKENIPLNVEHQKPTSLDSGSPLTQTSLMNNPAAPIAEDSCSVRSPSAGSTLAHNSSATSPDPESPLTICSIVNCTDAADAEINSSLDSPLDLDSTLAHSCMFKSSKPGNLTRSPGPDSSLSRSSSVTSPDFDSTPTNSTSAMSPDAEMALMESSSVKSLDPSGTLTHGSSVTPARSLPASHHTTLNKSIKNSLDLDLEKDLKLILDEELKLSSQLERAQESALAYAVQEEESWLKELAREQSTQVDEDMDIVSDIGIGSSSLDTPQTVITDWDSLVAFHEAEMKQSPTTSWGDLVEAEETRTPGHGVHMHEKLSSPSRKRSPTESRRRHEEKQAKAQELREKLMQEKAERLRDLSKKVEEVRAYKEDLMKQSKTLLEHKLQRAEEKRQLQLKLKARKAHEEEAKANEIAFINCLEAQNKRHDIMSKHQESEARLHDMQEERQRKLEEKQAKEAAVEERRKALEADRKARLLEMQEKRKLRDARIEQQQMDKEKERLLAARAKGKEREERLAALTALQEAQKQELQKKIQQKQDETTQRHEVHLQHIRDRAFEMSIMRHSTEDHNDAPKLTPYDRNKLCVICNALIPSEVYLLSHLRGKKHQQALRDNNSGKEMTKEEIETFNLKHIVDAPDNSNHPKIVTEKERQKSLKKRCKKLRQRMVTRGLEYENTLVNKQQQAESEHKAKLHKAIKDINKYLQFHDSGPWPQNKVSALDRALGEISRILEKKNPNDQTSFRVLGGFSSLSRILITIEESSSTLPCVIPPKSLSLTTEVYRLACKNNFDSCHYMLFSNKIGSLVDHLITRLNAMMSEGMTHSGSAANAGLDNGAETNSLPFDPVCVGLMQVLSTVLSCLAKNNPASNCSEASSERMNGTGDAFSNRGNDVISYIISVGIIDKLRVYFSAVRGPLDGHRNAADLLLHGLGLLVAMTKFMSKRNVNVCDGRRPEDPSQLIHTFEVTELVGIVSLLYGMLLHSGAPCRSQDSAPRPLAAQPLSIILTGLRMLNHMAVLDLGMLQRTLGEEGLSLEFRHIASYLVWYCSHVSCEELLHEVVLCVGYFCVLHADNQVMIQSGQPPTVLQQLCALPFHYFSDPRLVAVLFPTLICCCFKNCSNRHILEQELNSSLLANFIEEKQMENHQYKLTSSSCAKKNKNQENKEVRDTENRVSFTLRFPVEQWQAAVEYFRATS